MRWWLPLFCACAGALVAAGCGAGSVAPAAPVTDRDARVRLESSGTHYRDLSEALLFAREGDTIGLAPGLYRGAFTLEGKRVRVQGSTQGEAILLVPSEGIAIGAGAHLDLARVVIEAEGQPTDVAALRVQGGSATLTDVVARDLPRPALAFDSPGRLLTLLRCRFQRGRGPVLDLLGGAAWVGASVAREGAGPAFRLASGAGPLHLSHVSALGNAALVEAAPGDRARWAARATVTDDLSAGVDPVENLVLGPEEIRSLFPDAAKGDLRPREMPRQDRDGLDYGAIPSDAGLQRARAAFPRWLDLFDDRAALRALALLPEGALGGQETWARLKDTFYRRVASFLAAGQPGLLSRDLMLVMPFAPAQWQLGARLEGAQRALVEGLPGRLLVVGPPDLAGPVGEQLERVFAAAYPERDPNQAWRVVLEIERPLTTTSEVEALERTHEFSNPEHEKRVRALDMLAHRRDTLSDKLTRLRAQVRGMEAKRAATGRAEPDPIEVRTRAQLSEAERELDQVLHRQVEVQQDLTSLPPRLSCVFRGQRRTIRESATLLVNGTQRLEPTRVSVELTAQPEPTCHFEGVQARWAHPEGDGWLADATFRGVLGAAWLPGRVDAIQAGLVQARHARATTPEADAFFRLLVQDMALMRMGTELATPTPPAAVDEWLEIRPGGDGYPRVSCPFVPTLPAQGADDPLRLLLRLRPALEAYALEHYLEPMFLWEASLAH